MKPHVNSVLAQVALIQWARCAYDTLTHGPAQKWPIKIKWAGPTKGPQDLAGHNGPAQLKANENFTRGKSVLVVPVNGLSDPKSDPIA